MAYSSSDQKIPNQSKLRLWSIVSLLTIASIIAYISRVNLSFALIDVHFKQLFHFTDGQRGALSSAFFWTYAAFQIPAGWVVDRYGTKYPVVISFIVWSLLTAATAAITGFTSLFAIRLLLGMVEATIHPASIRWIGRNYAEKHRGLAIGIFMSGSKFGPAIGATLAAWLIDTMGWRTMFFVLGVCALAWVVPWLLVVKANDREVVKANRVHRAGEDNDLSLSDLIVNPILWGTIIGTFCYMYFVYFCLTWMPAYLREARGLSLGSSGLYTAFSFAGMAVVAIAGGWGADRIIGNGFNPVTVRKTFTIIGFMLASIEVFGAHLPINAALIVSIVSLSGLGLATANYWALTQTLLPGRAIGRIVGIQNCAASVAGIVAPILTGWMVEKTGSYAVPMDTIVGFLLLGIFSYIVLVREKYSPHAQLAAKGA